MSPKEKAERMYGDFYGIPLYIKVVKICCTITINNTIAELKEIDENHPRLEYWEEVKIELEKL